MDINQVILDVSIYLRRGIPLNRLTQYTDEQISEALQFIIYEEKNYEIEEDYEIYNREHNKR